MASKLAALFAVIAVTLSVAPALAAPLQCSDRAIVDFVNTSLKTNATWGDNGKPATSKGSLQIVGTPRAYSATRSTLVCTVHVRHIDPSSGGSETLAARLTVKLRGNNIADATMVFLQSSQ